MPRRHLAFQAGHYYHLYNRGNNHQATFFERENYLHFLRLIRRHLTEKDVDLLAYCLMPNHYHLLVCCKADLTKGMQSVALAYTKAINQRYRRVGVLFQGRFQAIEVDNERYLHHLVQYIHLNPVKAQLVHRPEEWEFSSYHEYAGLRRGTLPKLEMMRSLLGEAAYRSFLAEQRVSSLAIVRALMLDE
jgi:REP element-mobilizing transposase RayT